MKMDLHRKLTAAVIAAVMVLAMTVQAFAHRMPAGPEASLEQFILAGGNLHDLCGDGILAPGECPLCRLSDAALPPTPPGGVTPVTWRLALVLEPVCAMLPGSSSDCPGPDARGPPSL